MLPKENTRNKKYISLKEAAKLLGYHPDYIGYLIRKGKIKGRKVYGSTAWFVNKEEVLAYKDRKKKKINGISGRIKKLKETKEIKKQKISPRRLIFDILPPQKLTKIAKEEILGMKPYKSRGLQYFNIGYRIFIGAILLFLIFSAFTGFSFQALGERELKTELYASNCQGTPEGQAYGAGWQNPKNAQGEPQTLSDSTIDSFSEGNSAVYQGGIGNLLCEDFRETDTEQKLETDTKARDFQSAKIYFSFAIDEKGHELNTKLEHKTDTKNSSRTVLGSWWKWWKRLFSFTPLESLAPNPVRNKISDGTSFLTGFIAQAQENGVPPTIPDNLDGNNIDTKIVIWYSTDNETWYTLDKIDSLPLSNAINGGYFSYEAPFLKDWEDVENLKIKFEGVVGGETNIVVFVDSIWVEAKYVEFKKAEIKVISLKRHFKGYEEPEFNIEELDKKGIITQLFRKIEIIDVSIWDYSTNKKLDIPSEVKGSEIKIKKPEDFRPGLYKLKVEYKEENELKTLEQEFTWGVLAINVNKSIYLPGEQAYIQIAALRDDGHTICDANLKLEITSPSGEQFSAPVQKSGECGPNNVTEKPDYFAYYQVGEVGIYEMELTNLDNGYKIKDSFEVRESVPFDIERIGPTRIWPKANYEMALKIKANQDFTGDIIETVPISFEILNQEIKQISNSSFIIQDQGDGTKSLTWQNITLQQGDEIEIKYTFDAPDITPYLHLIGPLKFYE